MADKRLPAVPMAPSNISERASQSTLFSPLPPLVPPTVISARQFDEGNRLPPISSLSSITMDTSRHCDLNRLMSPPEPILPDNFDHSQTSAPTLPMLRPQIIGPMSPPVSPPTKNDHTHELPATPQSMVIRDPILFPSSDVASSPPQRPLFPSVEREEHRRAVDEHVASRPTDLFQVSSPPKRADYELVLLFKSQVMKQYMNDPKAWLRKERELLVADRKASAQRKGARFATILPRKPLAPSTTTPLKVARLPRPDKIVKPVAPRPARRITPQQHSIRVGETPEPRRGMAPTRTDKDFSHLPDYCPPLSSLPDKANSLKVDWKANSIDLSGDPNVRFLHPDEVVLAANLRLDCATYLTSKRRLFIRRLMCAQKGKEFRKTDAQQACRIDVNKASKLWTAFEKVGWLDLGWMEKYMNVVVEDDTR